MKIFLTKIFVFSSFFYVILLLCHFTLINSLNSDDNYLPQGCYDYTLQNKEYSIIWLGNSRTYVHVDQSVINQNWNKSSYSLVQDGGDPSILFYKISNYLNNNNKPDIVNIQCDYTMETSNFEQKDIRISQLFNWKMKKHLEKTFTWTDPIYFYIPLVSFDITTIIKVIIKYRPKRFYNVFYEVNEPFGYKTDLLWNHNFISRTCDLTKSNYFDSIINICVNKEVGKINLWTPPSSKSLEESIVYAPNLDSIAKYYGVKHNLEINHIDLRDSTMFNDSTLFYNHTHLNKNGVNVLTGLIETNSKTLLEASRYKPTNISADGF